MTTQEQANAINNLSPGNKLYQVGSNLRQALNSGGRSIRSLNYTRWVDGSMSVSGSGEDESSAFKTITEGITYLNTVSGKGATLLIKPGTYVEKADEVPTLTTSDCLIQGFGLPEDTLWYGSGTNGTITAATDDLLTILGGNNAVVGLGMYVNEATKASIVFDDTGGGTAGSYNLIQGCVFSPQTQDGVGYGIKFSGGISNWILDNIFMGTDIAGILMAGGVGDTDRNRIENNHFIGTTIGLSITGDNHDNIVKDNWFSAGTLANEAMTYAVSISSGMTAGSITFAGNYFEQSAVNDILDSKAGGDVFAMNNFNGA